MSNLKYLCNFAKDNEKKSTNFIYAENAKELAKEFLLTEFNGYFGAEYNDLADDLLNDLEVEGFIEVTRESYGYRGPISDSLQTLKPDLIRLLEDITFEEFKEIIKKVNVELTKIGYTNKYIFFENEEEAYKYLKEEFDIDKDTYENVFDSVIMK